MLTRVTPDKIDAAKATELFQHLHVHIHSWQTSCKMSSKRSQGGASCPHIPLVSFVPQHPSIQPSSWFQFEGSCNHIMCKALISFKSAKSNKVVEDLLENAAIALDVAIQFGPVIPIPLVSSLISSAQVIVKAAQVWWYTITQLFELWRRCRYPCSVSNRTNKTAQSLHLGLPH